MSRILKRPMFRIGGSVNGGIMSGVVPTRAGYAEPQGAVNTEDNYQLDPSSDLYKNAMRNAAILSKFAGPARSEKDQLLDTLLRGSIRLASETPRGNIFATTAKAFQEPVEQYLKAGEAEDSFQRQLRLAGVTQAMTSEEAKAKYDKEVAIAKLKLEQDAKENFLKTNANTLGIKAEGVWETLKEFEKKGISVSRLPVNSVVTTGKGGIKVAKPDPQDVATIPEGKVFFDSNSNFYKRVKEGPGWIRVQTSGEPIPAPTTPPKQPSFFDTLTDVSPDDIITRQYLGPAADLLRTKKYDGGMTTVDPRPWNKQKFYEDLLKKNKASME